jgi:hypothetical protein
MSRPATAPSPVEAPQIAERGANGQSLDRRLFMQLLAFGNCSDPRRIIDELVADNFQAAVYADVNDPYGVALLTMHDDPAFFVDALRPVLHRKVFTAMTPKPALTMFGRTYSLGYEPDLNDTLFERPRRTALNPDWPWAVWYPLRRSGAFARLADDEQRKILMEHGVIGRSFGSADLGHDVRLACFGLDQNDNDFVVGLMGKQLHPLSVLVQTMRKTTQTSMYIERLGPFFVGRKLWQSAT